MVDKLGVVSQRQNLRINIFQKGSIFRLIGHLENNLHQFSLVSQNHRPVKRAYFVLVRLSMYKVNEGSNKLSDANAYLLALPHG